MTVEGRKVPRGFQTEAKRLLHLMIHSPYSSREIFLRELVSNASDAADKLRFEAVSNGDLYEGGPDLKIRGSLYKEAKTITISDNGIGKAGDEGIDKLRDNRKCRTAQVMEKHQSRR